MTLSQSVINVYEGTSRTGVHIDNFIAKLKSIARLTNTEIVNLDEIRAMLIAAAEDEQDVDYKLKSRWPDKGDNLFEANKVFWGMYRDSCDGIIKILKRLHGKDIDEKLLTIILSRIEVREKKKR